MSVSFSTIVQRARPKSTHVASSAFRDVIANIPPTTVTALSNGFRIACEENNLARMATVGLFLQAGTAHDPASRSGTARVLEKCGFLGTDNQNKIKLTAALDEIGGHLQVETGRESSQLLLKVAPGDVEKAVGLLADVVLNARLHDEDIQTAKQQVNALRLASEEMPDKIAFDNLHRCAFDSTISGLGAPLYGLEDEINAVDRSGLEQFRRTNYVAGRMCLVGSGAVSHSTLEKSAQKFFGNIAQGSAPALDVRYVGGDIRLWNLRYKTTHIAWAVETCGASCEDSVPLALATQIHGSFHRSQHELGQHAIHRVLKTYSNMDHGTPTNTHMPEQCIETCRSFLHQYSRTGLMGMYIVGRPYQTGPGDAGSMMEVWQYTMGEWCRLTQKMLHEHELEQAKVNQKAQLLFNMDGSTNSALDIGRQVLAHGRRVPVGEMFDRIDDITGNNVQEALQHYFFGRRPVYSFLGYTYPLPHYDYSSHWTYKIWY